MVRSLSEKIKAELKIRRGLFTPFLNDFTRWSLIESGIPLHSIKDRRIFMEKMFGFGFLAEKVTNPILESPLRQTDMVFFNAHNQIKYECLSNKRNFHIISLKNRDQYDFGRIVLRLLKKRKRFQICITLTEFYILSWWLKINTLTNLLSFKWKDTHCFLIIIPAY